MMSHRFVLLSMWLALVLPRSAAAEETSSGEAVALYNRGLEAWDQGELDEAATFLQQSYRATPNGLTACALGRLARERQRLVSAVFWLNRCAESEGVDEVRRAEAAAEAEALSLRNGSVRVHGAPSGQAISVDGSPRHLSDDDVLALPAGGHRLAYTDSAGRVREVQVEVVGGAEVEVDLNEPEPGTAERQEAQLRRPRRFPFWLMLGATVLTGGGAIAAWAVEGNLIDQLELERADQAGLAAAVLMGVAGACLAATVILIPYVFNRRGARGARSTALVTRWLW